MFHLRKNFLVSLMQNDQLFSRKTTSEVSSETSRQVVKEIKSRMENFKDFQGRKVSPYSPQYAERKKMSPWKNMGGSLIQALKTIKGREGESIVTFAGKHKSGINNRQLAGFVIAKKGRDFFRWNSKSKTHKKIVTDIKKILLRGGR